MKAKVEIRPPAGGAGHARQHVITDPLDHTSPDTPGQILQADANGLPIDATNSDAQVAAAVAAAALAHARQHAITNPLDHTSGATPGRILQADANGLPVDGTNTNGQVAAAVAAAHAQGTDVALGAVGVKNPPIDADKPLYRDSTAGDALVTSTWTQIKAFFKTYFDTLYSNLAHKARHEPGGADAMTVDAAAVTGSLRTIGLGALQAAAGNHAHTLISGGSGSAYPGWVAAGSGSYMRASLALAMGGTYSLTVNINCNSGRVFGVAWSDGTPNVVDSVFVNLYIDGVWVASSGTLETTGTREPVSAIGFRTVGAGVIPVRADLVAMAATTVYWYGGSAGLYRPLTIAGGEVRI